jgi:hypothetical protein
MKVSVIAEVQDGLDSVGWVNCRFTDDNRG